MKNMSNTTVSEIIASLLSNKVGDVAELIHMASEAQFTHTTLVFDKCQGVFRAYSGNPDNDWALEDYDHVVVMDVRTRKDVSFESLEEYAHDHLKVSGEVSEMAAEILTTGVKDAVRKALDGHDPYGLVEGFLLSPPDNGDIIEQINRFCENY